MNFFERVKAEIPVFLTELSKQIQNDLFKFSEDRINEITKEYKLRMNENDLKKFIQKLSEK